MSYESPFAFFVEHWWYGMVIFIVFHYTAYLTKGGRWSRIWTGRE